MKSNSNLRSFAGVLLVIVSVVAPAEAQKYLTEKRLDGATLLAPPPISGSEEYAADLASARSVFKGRTPEQESRANKSAHLTVFNFAPAIGSFFTPEKLPKTDKLFQEIKPDIKPIIEATKEAWKRKRPYEVDATLTLGKPEPSPSYPSGHSTVGMIQALLLVELFPEKREAILERGRGIGWDRVVIGKHFPTDVHAGRVLAQAIAREFLASPAFQRDLAEVKAEIAAAQK